MNTFCAGRTSSVCCARATHLATGRLTWRHCDGDVVSPARGGDPNLLAIAPCLSASGVVWQPAAQASRRHLPPRKKKARATAMRRCWPLSVRSLTMSWSPRLRRAAQLSCSKSATSCAQRARELAGRSQITDTPWIDLPVRLYPGSTAPLGGRRPDDAEPRVFKTHGGWGKVRRCGPCRKITCWRDPVDVMLSSFHFMLPLSGLTPGDDVSLSTFCRVFIHGHGRYLRSYCADLIEWWEHRHDPDVLFLLFDEVVQHKPAAIRRVAAFMGCEADVALVALVAKMTSHAAMRADRGRFNDDALLAPSLWRRRGDVPVPLAGKVRADGGISGQGAEQVPAWAVKEVQRVWTATVAKATGLTTFAALSELRSAELRRAQSRSAERPPRGV